MQNQSHANVLNRTLVPKFKLLYLIKFHQPVSYLEGFKYFVNLASKVESPIVIGIYLEGFDLPKVIILENSHKKKLRTTM